jgi:prepilin-type N-terminal cleavage/methylation domain-containing protein
MKELRNERGLSLIEVLASLFILSMALLFLSNFLVRSYELSGDEDVRAVAMNIARLTAEQWKNGQGTIDGDASNDSLPSGVNRSDYAGKTLDFALLAQLTDDLGGAPVTGAEYDVVVNGKTYRPQVFLEYFPNDPGLPPEKNRLLILITVKVTLNKDARVLAALQTAVANPARG